MVAVPASASVRPGRWTVPRLLDPDWGFNWLAGLGFAALTFLLSYPGRLNGDSLYTLIGTTKPGLVNNWHSATLGWLWDLPGPLLGQPTAALARQAALFGAFAGFLPRRSADSRSRAALAGELLLRFVLAGAAGYIGKDAVILLALLIMVQLLRSGFRRATLLPLVAVVTLFLLVKVPNFLVIVAAIALVAPFFARSAARYAALVVGALVIGALAIPLNRTIDARVFGAKDLHPDKQLVLFDLAGISVRTGDNAFAKVPGWPTAKLKPPSQCYVPWMWDSFAHWAPCGGYATAYDPLDAALKGRWIREIASHPLAYAQHRWAYVSYLMTSRDHDTWGLDGQAINDATSPAALKEMRAGMTDMAANRPIGLWHPSPLTEPVRWLERVLFRFPNVQWAGLIACLSILVFSWMRRADGIRLGAIVAAALGVGNFAMLAVFGVADPGRYMLPTVALAYLALLALLAPARKAAA